MAEARDCGGEAHRAAALSSVGSLIVMDDNLTVSTDEAGVASVVSSEGWSDGSVGVSAVVVSCGGGSNSAFFTPHVGQHHSLLSTASRFLSLGEVSKPPIAPFASVWKKLRSAVNAVRIPQAGCHDS